MDATLVIVGEYTAFYFRQWGNVIQGFFEATMILSKYCCVIRCYFSFSFLFVVISCYLLLYVICCYPLLFVVISTMMSTLNKEVSPYMGAKFRFSGTFICSGNSDNFLVFITQQPLLKMHKWADQSKM